MLKTNKKRHFMLAIIIGMSAFVSTAASTITWEIAKIDSIGDVGLYCDLGIDNMGHLYVVYLREDERTLKALSNNGGSWGSSWILDSSGAVAGYCGIALDGGGVPRVSYRRDDTHALWYAGPESPRVWTVEAIDEPGDVGSYCDLTLDNLGNLHAAYLRADEKALKHIASDLGYWLAPATVDASGAVAGYCGIALDGGGVPRVSYRRDDTHALWYAGPESIRKWSIRTAYETQADAGKYVSLQKAPDGRLGAVFYRFDKHTGGTVCMLVIEDGVIGATRVVADSVGLSADDPTHIDLAISGDGVWHIAYRNQIEHALYHATTTDTIITGVDDKESPWEPETEMVAFHLEQNVPNPFNPQTTIMYSIGKTENVVLAVFDVNGRLIRTLVNERKTSGKHHAAWDGTNNQGDRIASGVYFLRLTAGNRAVTKKLILLR
jgi:hypothetical protein